MAIVSRLVEYHHGEQLLEGYLACDDRRVGPLPLVMVCHTWVGRDDFACGKARALAELGYAGFALDMYGKGLIGKGPEENARLMKPFQDDRRLLQARIGAALNAAKALPEADPRRIAAIGFCFGGLCVLDLARSGAELRAVASFHGLLVPPGNTDGRPIKAKVLVMHGYDDPMAPPAQVVALADELTRGGADWQIHAYGGTVHAFTNPRANDPGFGTVYDAVADQRSWRTLGNFLTEVLN